MRENFEIFSRFFVRWLRMIQIISLDSAGRRRRRRRRLTLGWLKRRFKLTLSNDVSNWRSKDPSETFPIDDLKTNPIDVLETISNVALNRFQSTHFDSTDALKMFPNDWNVIWPCCMIKCPLIICSNFVTFGNFWHSGHGRRPNVQEATSSNTGY